MLTVHCSKCENMIGDSDHFSFFQKDENAYHLIVKLDKRNYVLKNLIINESSQKKKKFNPNEVFCAKKVNQNKDLCGQKLGGEFLIGPKSEIIICLKNTKIMFCLEKKFYKFNEKTKWSEQFIMFPQIEMINIDNFYGYDEKIFRKTENNSFVATVYPTELDVLSFNIGSLVRDMPREYQVELYVASLLKNTVCYMPTGSGKTMVAAMVAAYMKFLNPKKKVYFACNRIPLVFQQASYFRHQTGLSVGEFCGQNKENNRKNFDYDILCFTSDLLLNKLAINSIFLEDCCCLVIDEIHHATRGDDHSFRRLIQKHYINIDKQFRPRLLGLTASPSSKNEPFKIHTDIQDFERLIDGQVYMPFIYEEKFNSIVNRPELTFIQSNTNNQNMTQFFLFIVEMFQNFFSYYINSDISKIFKFDYTKQNNVDFFRNYLQGIIEETYNNQKKNVVAMLLLKLISSLEIASIVGVSSSLKFIQDVINKEIINRQKKIWNSQDVKAMESFVNCIKGFFGVSPKVNELCSLLRQEQNRNNMKQCNRIIVFVQMRRTTKILVDHLRQESDIKNYWNPQVIVGREMDWFEDQDPILEDFKSGKCRLLVSTNFLQEGIDVSACDKVILFDKMWTITEYIQSRGRARHEKSEFILIGSAEDQKHYNALIENERMLSKMIKNLLHGNQIHNGLMNMKNLETIMKLIEKTDRSGEFFKVNKHKRNSVNTKIKFSLQIYLNKERGDTHEFCKKLISLKGHKQTNEINDPFLNIFEKRISYNSLFEFKNTNSNANNLQLEYSLEAIGNILKNEDESNNDKCVIHLFQSKSALREALPNIQTMCAQLEFGNLASPFEFIIDSSNELLFKNNKLIIDYKELAIKVLFFSNSNLYKIELQFDSIDQFICIDNISQESLNIFFPCNRAPFLYQLSPDEESKPTSATLENLDEIYLQWERTCFKDSSFNKLILTMHTISLTLSDKKKVQNLIGFQHINNNQVIFSKVKRKNLMYTIDDSRRDFRSFQKDFETRYAFECFLSQCDYLLNGKIDKNFVKNVSQSANDSKQLIKLLERLVFYVKDSRYQNIMSVLAKLNADKNAQSFSTDLSIKNLKTTMIRRATITPSKTIFYFAEPFFSNRVIRHFDAENFLRLRFLDEDLRKLNHNQSYSDMTHVYDRIENILLNGISLHERKFEFLAMSSSQMREHGCWMFWSNKQDNLNADLVRKWMGNFENIKCVGKYAARLGQSMSSSIEAFQTNSNEFTIIPDIKSNYYEPSLKSEIEYVFTDGIGKISKSRALQICKDYYNLEYASAFQIRFAGFKGVLAIDTTLDNYSMQFRPSMNKFESQRNKLDVLNVAMYIPCFLNRQIIIILSTLGIEDKYFENLQGIMLNDLSIMLLDKNISAIYINTYFRNVFSFTSNDINFDYTKEPFFRDLLKTIKCKQLKGLIRKSRIFVKDGRILMGVIDETGLLKENECFIQCSIVASDSDRSETEKSFKKNGIATNKYFIVESKIAVAKNPCMAAGDVRVLNAVDIPQLRHHVDSIVFPTQGKRPISSMCSGSDLDGDLYFVTWNSTLIPERVETPLSYKSPPEKVKDKAIKIEDVIKFFVNFIKIDQLGRIANAHVALSDLSKLGVNDPFCIELAKLFSLAVDFPKHGMEVSMPKSISEKINKYPDFMEKNSKHDTYESQKVIGKMYRKSKKFEEYYSDADSTIEMNKSFIIDGYEAYLDEAIDLYLKYRIEIERAMCYFNCKHESELFIGVSLYSAEKEDEIKEKFKLSSMLLKKLWSYFRDLFLNKSSLSTLMQRQKASAWYYACYSSNLNIHQKRIISFPWIVEDVLLSIPNIKNFDSFSESIIENYCDSRDANNSISTFMNRLELKKNISNILGLELIMVDSNGLFIFEDFKSDVNFLIYDKNSNEKINISSEIEYNLKNNFDHVSLDQDMIILQVKNQNEDDQIVASIYSKNSTLRRFLYLRKQIFMNPIILPFIYTIVHFTRLDNVFLLLNNQNIKIDLFIEFCLDFCDKNNLIHLKPVNDDIYKQFSVDSCDEWFEVHDILNEMIYNNIDNSSCIGKTLLYFYKNISFDPSNIIFMSKFEPIRIVLNETSNRALKDHFFRIFNLLSSTTNVYNVWNTLTKNEPNFKRKFYLSKRKGKSKSLFAENASLMLFSNSTNCLDSIDFELYNGKRRSMHLTKQCYKAKLIKKIEHDLLLNSCFEDYLLHSVKQFNMAKEAKSFKKFRFCVKFGDIYITSLPTILIGENASMPLYKLQEALKKSYKNYKIDETNVVNNNLALESEEEDDIVLKKPDIPSTSKLSDDDYDHEEKPKAKKKKKKTVVKLVRSAFDSNVDDIDEARLISLLNKNEFDLDIRESYTAYLELNDFSKKTAIPCKIKYNENLELKRIEILPIKWLCIDIHNQSNESNKESSNRDIRIFLLSEKQLTLNSIDDDDNIAYDFKGILNDKLKNNDLKIFHKSGSNDDQYSDVYVLTDEFKSCTNVFICHSKCFKYQGSIENWLSLFKQAGIQLHENFPSKWLELLFISVLTTFENSDNDESGHFRIRAIRKQCVVMHKIEDISLLTTSECKELCEVMWTISKLILKLFL